MTFQALPPSWRELFDMGIYCTEAARIRGVTRQAAESWARSHGLKWPDGRRREFNPQPDRKCPCRIRGVEYPSISEAARAHRVKPCTVQTHLAKHGHADFVGLRRRRRTGRLPANAKQITIAGITYPSIGAAARDLETNKAMVIDWREGRLSELRRQNFVLKVMKRDGRIASQRMR